MASLVRVVGLLWLLIASTGLCEKPKVPLSSTSRWIVDSDNKRVKLRCINWAGHMEVNLPEGLHKQPISSVADWIKNNGFNCVRLTYSTDMARNPGRSVRESFRAAAGEAGVPEAGMLDLYNQAVAKNPFLANAGIRDVFGAVVDELWARDIMTILDNHVSKPSWCCNLDDGNGWWKDALIYSPANSRFFDSNEWMEGLRAMAAWSRGRPGIVGLSLRNELRAGVSQILFATDVWYNKIPAAARAVHEGNPDALVIVGGMNGGTDLSSVRVRSLDTGPWKNKNVWEAHDYSFTVTTPDLGDCGLQKQNYGLLYGFLLEQNRGYTGPLWISEFGVDMQGGPNSGLNDVDYAYLTCLVSYLESNDADWALWAIQGSYYVRDKIIDMEETWGALNKDWTDWRNRDFKAMLGKMWETTQGPR